MSAQETHAYRRFDPGDCGFPAPPVALWPRPTRATWRRLRLAGDAGQGAPSAGRVEHFSRARYAIDRVLSALAGGGGVELLAPSYHCRTMLDAAVARGARVGLYPLTPSLAPDLDALAAMLKARGGPSTVVLSTHFFGFPAPIAEVLALCRAAGATLIEDCSHCLVDGSGLPAGRAGASDGRGGVHGDFVIASPYKMFPAQDGGTLWTRRPLPPDDGCREPGPGPSLRAWAALARDLLSARPAPPPAAAGRDARPCGREEAGQDGGAPSPAFEPRMSRAGSLPASRWVVRHSRLASIIEARRSRFVQWAGALSGVAGLRPLHDTLDSDTVPYVFPLLLDGSPDTFFALKRWGVALGRWDDMLDSSCRVAAHYRTALVHLPCHQEITDPQMAWMIDSVRRAATP